MAYATISISTIATFLLCAQSEHVPLPLIFDVQAAGRVAVIGVTEGSFGNGEENVTQHLKIVDLSGNELRRINDYFRPAGGALAIDHAGDSIAYVTWPEQTIRVVPVAGERDGVATNLGQPPAYYRLLEFSPDNTKLRSWRGGDLVVFDVVSGKETVVASGGIGYYPAWSPNSQTLTFSPKPSASVLLVNADGTGKRQVVSLDESVVDTDRGMAFSPDGGRIGFVRELREGPSRLEFCTVRTDGTDLCAHFRAEYDVIERVYWLDHRIIYLDRTSGAHPPDRMAQIVEYDIVKRTRRQVAIGDYKFLNLVNGGQLVARKGSAGLVTINLADGAVKEILTLATGEHE